MLRILGMSHAISMLRALGTDGGIRHDNWNVALESPQWHRSPLPAQWAQLPFDALGIFLIRPAMNWQASLTRGNNGDVLAAHPGYWTLLETMGPQGADDALVSFIGGNDHSVMSLVEVADPYDFRLPGDDSQSLLPGRQPVELKYVAAQLEQRMNPTVAQLTALRYKHPALRIWHVTPPPPIASEQQILREPEIFRNVIDRYGITPLTVRMKVYRLYCRLLSAHLARLSISALEPPAAASDAAGALREEFAFGCTHGNEAYGALVADQLQVALG